MSVEKYIKYLEGMNLTEKEKIMIINHLIKIYGRLFDVKTR